jgi:hypothetical protein
MRGAVRVARPAHLVSACLAEIAAVDKRSRTFDTQVLEVGKGRFSEHSLATPLQCPRAPSQRGGCIIERETLLEMVSRPPLEALNDRICLFPRAIAASSALNFLSRHA